MSEPFEQCPPHVVSVRQDRTGLLCTRSWQGVCLCGWASAQSGRRRKAEAAASAHLAYVAHRRQVRFAKARR